jgi:hypothetical protein
MSDPTYSPSTPWPTNELSTDYGTCLRCVFDLMGGTSTGRQALAEALARRLMTDQGTLVPVGPEDTVSASYGYNLISLVNGRIKAADLSQMSANIINQFRQDDRVQDALCEVTYISASGVLIINATIYDRAGPFPLTLSVNDVTVTILSTQGSP